MILAWVDGASKGNPGPSGWGAVVYDPTRYIVARRFGGRIKREVTNSVAELRAVLEVLYLYPNEKEFTFYSDSKYVVYILSGRWKAKANLRLIQDIWSASQHKAVDYHLIPREDNVVANNLAQTYAGMEA